VLAGRQHPSPVALVAPPQRAGGQAQYIERLRPQASGDRLAPLRDWMLANLASDLSTDVLAEHAHMSRRTLIRRFREETGTSPMAWLASARIDQARELLETADDPIEHIGHITGLGAPASVRAAFHRHIGTSPQQYRSLFRGQGSTPVAGCRKTGAEWPVSSRPPAKAITGGLLLSVVTLRWSGGAACCGPVGCRPLGSAPARRR